MTAVNWSFLADWVSQFGYTCYACHSRGKNLGTRRSQQSANTHNELEETSWEGKACSHEFHCLSTASRDLGAGQEKSAKLGLDIDYAEALLKF